MDVRLPDGTIIQNVPDGTTQLELENRLVRAGMRESLNPEGLTDESRGFFANLPETGEENVLRAAGEMQKRGMLGDIVRSTIGTPTHEKRARKEQAVPRSYLNSLSGLLSALEEQGMQDTPQYKQTLAEYDQAVALDEAEPSPGFKEMVQGAARMAAEDPGALAAGLVTGIAEDPILALTPLGYRAGAARAAEMGASRAAQVGAGMGTAGGLGAATMAPISAMEQLDVRGDIDPGQVAAESAMAGLATGALGPLFAGRARPRVEPEARPTPEPEAPTAEDVINRVYGDVLKEPEPVTPELPAPEQPKLLPAPETKADVLDLRLEGIDARLSQAKDDLIKQQQIDAMWAKHEKIETPEDIQITRDSLDATDPRYLAHVNEMNQTKAAIEAAKGRPKNTTMEDALRGVEATKVTDKDMVVRLSTQNTAKQLDDILKRHNMPIKGNKKQKAERIVAFNKQQGGMSPEMAAFLGAGVTGAGIGWATNPSAEGAGVGALMGLLAAGTGKALVAASKKAAHRLSKPHNEIRITDHLNNWDGEIASHQRDTMQIRDALRAEIPDKAEREAISHYMEGDTSVEISDAGKKWADNLRKVFDEIHRVAKDEGVIETYWDNYVPHLWQIKTTPNDLFDALIGQGQKYGRTMSGKTMHAKERLIPTLREGKDLGLVPKTEDIADLVKIYGDSVFRAVMNKKLRQQLGELEDPGTGKKLIMKVDEAPPSYKQITSPHLMGMSVHPDIEPSMRFIYQASSPGEIMRGISALNFASKRMLVSGSFFHANALLESMLYAGINPLNWTKGKLRPSKVIPGGLPTNARRSIDMLRHGKAGDVVDIALRSGLKIGTIEDVGSDVFYGGLKQLQDALETRAIGKPLALAVKGFEGVNRFVDKIMWDTIMTGGKLTVFSKQYEKALLNPKNKHIPKEVLAQEVAGYVNDAFGGQNWMRMAEAVQGRFARRLAQRAFSPEGRQFMQLGLFAPDWTTSNLKILAKALPGINKNPRTLKMHGAYFARGALLALIGGSIVQSLIQGKPTTLLENKDKTTVDLGDGRKMTWSKQFFEPYHWATEPGKTFMNKLGSAPRAVMEQGLNRKWISPYGAPKIVQEPSDIASMSFLTGELPARLMQLGGKFVPIAAQQTANYGPGAGLAGFLGHPIYKQSWD